MKRCIALFAAALLCLGVALVTGASPASARSAVDWTVTHVSVSHVIGRGGQQELTADCPSGQTPISGGYTLQSTDGGDARRMYEYTEFGTGQHYRVGVDDQVPVNGGASDVVFVTVNCVASSLFSDSAIATTTATVGSDHLATAIANCASGWSALSADVWWNNAAGQTLLTSTPDLEFDGWYARGYNDVIGASLLMVVHCVPASNIPAVRIIQHGDSVGWGSAATASCPTGLIPLTGGSYHSGGDGGAIAVQPHPTPTGWASLSEGLGGGTMYTNVICIPGADPTIGYNGNPYPNLNSTSARWDFAVDDPAAAGNYGAPTTTCTVKKVTVDPFVTLFSNQPCSSPFQLDNLADGGYTLFVDVTTGDGRTNQPPPSGWEVFIDTTPPVLTFDKPSNSVYGAHAPSIPVHLDDATIGVKTVTCAVDGGAPVDTCLVSGPRLDLPSLPDGTHSLHVVATDLFTNAASFNYTFRVDTTAPTVTQKTPAASFTAATTVPVTWAASDAIAGMGSYGVQVERAPYDAPFGAWSATVAVAGTATSRSFTSLVRGSTYCFHMKGVDKAGNTSDWTTSRCTAIPFDDRDLADSSGWTAKTPRRYFRGTAMYTTTRGATLSRTGVTLRRVGIVARKCPTCGVVGVYVGTTLIGKVALHSTTSVRAVIPLPAFTLRTAAVKIKVLSSGKPVFIDALGVSRV